MVITTFTPEWKLWIWSNIVNGYDKESIFNVLLNNGFDYNLIKRELEIEPTNTLIWQRQYSQENLNQSYDVELYPYNKSLCDNPRAYRVENNLMEIYHFPELLTYVECDELISLTNKKLNSRKKTVDNLQELVYKLDKKSEIYKTINDRLNSVVGMRDSVGEDLFIQKITPDYVYDEKYDLIMPPTKENDPLYETHGFRAWSVQISLNNITEGGHLTFNTIERNVKPVKGDAIIYKNIHHNGQPNPQAKHIHQSTEEGDKYVLFKYYRQEDGSQINKEGQQEIEIKLDEIK
jgi:prolyl 4-hydroxylase